MPRNADPGAGRAPCATPGCQGACDVHEGEVRPYRVWHGAKDWGTMWYCSAAVAEDTRRGLLVEILEDADAAK